MNACYWLFLYEFQYSICNEPLIELSNPGASSSWFYLTSDDEFVNKTVQHKEAEFLQKLLPGYYMVSPSLNTNTIPGIINRATLISSSAFRIFLFKDCIV